MNILALIATRKGLFSLDKNHRIAPMSFSGVPVSMVLAKKDFNTWYAALDHGHFGVKFHCSKDQGKSWQEVSTPSYPKTSETDKSASLKLIWSLEFAQSNTDQCLWAGTVPGGLFYSEDGGNHWQLNQPLWQLKQQQQWFGGGFDEAGIHSIIVHPEDPKNILIAVSCAGVWQTLDGGQSWQNRSKGMRAEYMPPEQAFDPLIQDPHRLAQCTSSPEHLWVQHHNGIFKSTDGAKQWSEIEKAGPSTFGFTTVVHPQDPNTAWFVPGVKDECRIPVNHRLVVSRTRDGGQSFEVLDRGLPKELSSDLIFRHALDIDLSGQVLIMGSTTGNLWISENQGDNWTCLSNYLPPIYAVSFIH